ncbi:DUF3566 domain-containing protein [Bogoriella caseilytica]|uniref:Transmembrane protein DUF3566 n=1 Tax=Bogoriella caseilytica TaxID=56055 RepID=A0A3N2BCY5_9MICO|nr:DUF3566 domain-containing protein [Bogoriella caseilytica]ROR72924.1 transmembrane protein DUF3566 [Bogoriella caseilytica]
MSTHTPDSAPPPPPPPEDDSYGPGTDYSASSAPESASQSMREPASVSPSAASAAGSAPSAAGAATQTLPASHSGRYDDATAPQSGTPASTSAHSAAATAEPAAAPGPRRVRLAVSRVDPWSAMKLSFLLSFAIGIMMVVATAVVWFAFDSMMVFASVEELLESIGSEALLELMQYVEFDRVMSFATIVAVFDVLLLTALGTIMAFVYNIIAALVGGLHLTLTDD